MEKSLSDLEITVNISKEKVESIIDKLLARDKDFVVLDSSIEFYLSSILEGMVIEELQKLARDKTDWKEIIKQKLEDKRDQIIEKIINDYTARR